MINLARLKKSFNYAGRGWLHVLKQEQNFKLEILAGVLVLALALYLKLKASDIAILVLTVGFVLLMEIVNSLVESLSDLLKPKLNHYVKTIKDMGAAAVLTAALTAIIVGILIFSQYI